ncbi:hypothetical protein [Priestia flexa]|uniref:hypothetical protein n=1 Tax=Priestia flexa TaxID=86664 RepID=UPI00099D083F|nr:hypothetical protein [Priestia flexa]AQX56654.1 hypothetical protein BC359_20840 [Priestia flexa]AQX56665.1 hypothetical protein BC359_20900 [Priestia flexa]AQX56676.1 hypothetical protein BC359_20960 [Priestia flexa]
MNFKSVIKDVVYYATFILVLVTAMFPAALVNVGSFLLGIKFSTLLLIIVGFLVGIVIYQYVKIQMLKVRNFKS